MQGQTSFEELKNGSPFEKTKVELKILPNHLKCVFLEENETKPVVINSEIIAEEENMLVEVLKRRKEAHIIYQRNQPCLLYAQDNDGGRLQTSQTALEKAQPINEGKGTERGAQASRGWAYLPHF